MVAKRFSFPIVFPLLSIFSVSTFKEDQVNSMDPKDLADPADLIKSPRNEF